MVKFAEAVEQFRHALRIQADYRDARYNLANALAAQGKMEEAATNFRQVLSGDPSDVSSTGAFGRSADAIGRLRIFRRAGG